jgi:hypothetical protein
MHVRIDFYVVQNRVVFGELSFSKGAGFDKTSPNELNIHMSSWLKLPNKK